MVVVVVIVVRSSTSSSYISSNSSVSSSIVIKISSVGRVDDITYTVYPIRRLTDLCYGFVRSCFYDMVNALHCFDLFPLISIDLLKGNIT